MPFKRYRDIAIVVALLVVPFFVLRANIRHPEHLSALDRAVLRVVSPIEFASTRIARGLSNVIESYTYLVDVKADNERLRYENARLREQVHKLEDNTREIRELKRLLALRDSLPPELVSASVMGDDYAEFFRVRRLVLDRGSRLIRPHMPVIHPDGVVGSVVDVVADTVTVQLSVDAAFVVDVEDERTHARGFVRGTGDTSRYACRVEMIDARDEVEIGDRLITSGKGKWFPRGIPVARVTKVQKRELGREQDVEAVPTVDFSRLSNVLIVATDASEEVARPAVPGRR